MLISVQVSNFYSFSNSADIDFKIGKKPASSGFDINYQHYRLNKVLGVIGANGAGKTHLIKSLAFLSWFTQLSFLDADPNADLPYSPHALTPDDLTTFKIDFLLNDIHYRYQLELHRGRVVLESLFQKTAGNNVFSYVFKREKVEGRFIVRTKAFPFPKAQAEKIRDNASLLAAAHSYDVAEAKTLLSFFNSVYTNIFHIGRRYFEHSQLLTAAEFYQNAPEIRALMQQTLSSLDLGLTEILLEEKQIQQSQPDGSLKAQTIFMPYGVHTNSDGNVFKLSFFEESSGTQTAFVGLLPIFQVLHNGGIAVIDELDNDLHPHLIPLILDWFRFDETNPHRAQLIFSCHTPEILNRLQKHQIYICEKEEQYSSAWRVDQISGIRADDNLYAKYMAGSLGGIPDL